MDTFVRGIREELLGQENLLSIIQFLKFYLRAYFLKAVYLKLFTYLRPSLDIALSI